MRSPRKWVLIERRKGPGLRLMDLLPGRRGEERRGEARRREVRRGEEQTEPEEKEVSVSLVPSYPLKSHNLSTQGSPFMATLNTDQDSSSHLIATALELAVCPLFTPSSGAIFIKCRSDAVTPHGSFSVRNQVQA